MNIKKQKVKQAVYNLSLQAVGLSHSYLENEDETIKPIRCQFKSVFEIQIGNETIIKEVTNTVWINPEEPIFKEIMLHSQHVIVDASLG